jgi:DNA polymerase III delta prime subunit
MTKPDIDRLTAIERDWRRAANDLQYAADQAREAVATAEALAAEPESDPQDEYVKALEAAVHIAQIAMPIRKVN